MRRGGEIEVQLGAIEGGGTIETHFIDNGDPVPSEDLARLFDPFYVRPENPEELGTNLMACYLTIFHHGGGIRAERTEDGRNALIFTLPIVPTPPVDEESDPSSGGLWRLADFSHRDLRAATAVLPA